MQPNKLHNKNSKDSVPKYEPAKLVLLNEFCMMRLCAQIPEEIQAIEVLLLLLFLFQFCSVNVDNMHMILLKDASNSSLLHLTMLQLQTHFSLKKSVLVSPIAFAFCDLYEFYGPVYLKIIYSV